MNLAVDQDCVFAEERARLTARAWDGEEPINYPRLGR